MLKKLFGKSFRKRAGFTLIELLVVVAILGVLAAIVVPNVGKFIGSGKTEAANTESHNVQTAVLAAMADTQVGSLTAASFDGTHDITLSGNSKTVTVSSYLVGGLSKIKGTYAVATDGSITP